jgi:hypothetical protein
MVGITLGLVVLGIAGLLLYTKLTPQHWVLLDNGNDFAIEVDVGAKHVALAPHTSRMVRAHDGTLAIEATGPGFTEHATVELPHSGFFTAGRTALYNAGGASQLAIVSMTYGTVVRSQDSSPVSVIPKTDKLTLLPIAAYGEIDEAFPAEVKSKGSGVVVQRVCHVDVAAKSIACPGA